jgi:hypothetical protein
MTFTMPRRAGLSFVSVLGLAAFSALALPMGEAPPKANSQLAQAGPSPSTPLPDRDGATGGKQVPSRAETSDSIASPRTNGVLAAAPQSSGPASAPPAQSSSSARSASAASTNLVYTSSDRQNILRKLEQIRISRFSCDGEPLSEVILRLAIETRELDPDKQGIRILLGPEQNAAKVATGTIDPNTGLPVATPASLTEHYLDSVVIRLKEPLTDVRLASVLEAIVKSADKPIKYSTLDQGVLFSPKSPQPELYMRSFKVDPNAFFLRLQEAGAVSYSANDTPDQPGPVVVPKVHVGGTGFAYWNGSGGDGFNFVSTTNSIGGGDPAIIKYFLSMGVDLRPGTGKNVFYGDRYGNLLFNATKHDLNIIEAALQTLNLSPPQIHIKTKFIVVPESFTNLLAKWAPTNSAGTGVCASVLTPTQASGFLRDLESKTGTTLLTEGEVTTFSGRPAQIQQVDLKYIATMTTNGVLKSEPYPLGPTLDIVPHAASDGSILMVVSPQLLEFVGYDDPGPFQIQVTNSSGAVETASLLLPHFRVRQASLSANVPDGHTLVISGMSAVDVVREKNKVPVLGDLPIVGKLFRSERNGTLKNQLIVLVTPTIIDPAGNRLHPEDK